MCTHTDADLLCLRLTYVNKFSINKRKPEQSGFFVENTATY